MNKLFSLLTVLILFVCLTSCSSKPELQNNNPSSATKPTITNSTTAPPEKTTEAFTVDTESLTCKQAFVYDTQSGFVFLKGNPEEKIYPASITKLYTAYVALKYLNPTDIVTVGDEIYLVKPNSSVANLKKGFTLSVEDLIKGMLLPSGNDAAYVIAAAAGKVILGDRNCTPDAAVKVFVDEMNFQAASDGLVKTHFSAPDGYYDSSHYSTLYDICSIAQIVLSSDTISKCTSQQSETVYFENGESLTWTNTNLLMSKDSEYYREEVFGLKTGFVDESGYSLITAAKINGKTIITGVFGCSTANQRFEFSDTLIDAAKLFLNQ